MNNKIPTRPLPHQQIMNIRVLASQIFDSIRFFHDYFQGKSKYDNIIHEICLNSHHMSPVFPFLIVKINI